ncbi:hypothetical protein M2451_000027 [Dysgonomonas sp. PFB1-18]|nr:hypothetical protein [Dysgonomonas sp. PF1-14]MDH6337495.1 hypothetical protein [Dysgonomonas sp. PF1-16]MDH6378720.1 hypothetical protein [Dysgonomonas sp. PFB1-18]MDH6399138.1 hypothetical protein [Dysgonomonas sp. PF1-23]
MFFSYWINYLLFPIVEKSRIFVERLMLIVLTESLYEMSTRKNQLDEK